MIVRMCRVNCTVEAPEPKHSNTFLRTTMEQEKSEHWTGFHWGMLLLRIGLAAIFIYFHGWGKIVGGQETWVSYGERFGALLGLEGAGYTYYPVFWGFMAAFSEVIGMTLIALGLLFRPMAILMFITMVVAMASHIDAGEMGAATHPMKLSVVFFCLIITGPGKYALDYFLRDWFSAFLPWGETGETPESDHVLKE